MQHSERTNIPTASGASEAGGSDAAIGLEEIKHQVRIGGRDYDLVFNMLAIEAFFKVTGTSLFLQETLKQLGPEANPTYFTAALWSGLQTYHPEVTLDFIRKKLRFSEAQAAVRRVFDAIADDFPESRPLEPETAPAMKIQPPPTPAVLEKSSSDSGTLPASNLV